MDGLFYWLFFEPNSLRVNEMVVIRQFAFNLDIVICQLPHARKNRNIQFGIY